MPVADLRRAGCNETEISQVGRNADGDVKTEGNDAGAGALTGAAVGAGAGAPASPGLFSVSWKRGALIAIGSLVAALILIGDAKADFVVNGGFEDNTGPGLVDYPTTNPTTIANWAVTPAPDGYVFLMSPGSADTTGVPFNGATFYLWGPNNSSPGDPQYPGDSQNPAGGGPYLPATSPVGGYYIAMDADPSGTGGEGTISQTISGLTPGDQYQLGFWWAGAQ